MLSRAGICEPEELARLCVACTGVPIGAFGYDWLLTGMRTSYSPGAGVTAEAYALGDGCGGVGGGVSSCVCSWPVCFVAALGSLGSVQKMGPCFVSFSESNMEELGVATSMTGDSTFRLTPELPILDGKSWRWKGSTGVFTLLASECIPPMLPAVLRNDSLELDLNDSA